MVTFTSDQLESALEVIGTPLVELAVETDNPHADLFGRLCDVDRRGRSRNVTESYRRLDREHHDNAAVALKLELGACAHRFAAGHRLRSQVSGGAHPPFARNPDTGQPLATATSLSPTRYAIRFDRSTVELPVG